MRRMRFLLVQAGKEEKSRELLNRLQINTKHRNSFSYYRLWFFLDFPYIKVEKYVSEKNQNVIIQ